jgi:hypothetical protein
MEALIFLTFTYEYPCMLSCQHVLCHSLCKSAYVYQMSIKKPVIFVGIDRRKYIAIAEINTL